ncbi:MAG: TolC family protein [Cyanobacteria bacterium J06626_23]
MGTLNSSVLIVLALGGTSLWADSAVALSRPTETPDDFPSLGQLLTGVSDSAPSASLAQAADPSLPDLPENHTEPSGDAPETDAPETDTPTAPEAVETMPDETPAAPIDPSPTDPAEPTPAGLRTDPLFDADDLPPEDLLADPNPLSYPAFTEEVEIDESRVVTLEEAIELAYFNNPDLQTALLEVERAEAALDQARATYAPTVDVGADLTGAETTTVSGLGSTSTELDVTLDSNVSVNYDLFTAGQRAANVRSAEAQLRVSELEVERRQEALRLTTATLYYALQDATEQIRISQAFVEQSSQNLRDNRIRQEEGVGTRFDVLRAEVQFADARQGLIQAQSQERIAQRDLARLLNLPNTFNIEATEVERAGDWPLTLEESIILAFQNRAELEQQLAQRESSEQLARAALAANGPQISLFAQYNLIDITDSFEDTYSFGARFSMRLLDGGAARAQARQQEINADIAEQGFAQNLDEIRFDVEDAYYTLQFNEENISTAEIAVGQAQEALRLADLRLQNGVGTQLEVLEAQSDLVEAEGNFVSALLGYNRALAELQRAVSNLEVTL